MTRTDVIEQRISRLVSDFGHYVQAYDQRVPLTGEGPGSPPCHRHPDQQQNHPFITKGATPGPVEPPATGSPAGAPSYPGPKITNRSTAQPLSRASHPSA
jgi:hypothetical protein